MSKVDAWHLERVILRLCKVIANSYDLCSLYLEKSVFLLEKWEEVNEEITTFFMQPQQHGFFSNVSVQLTALVFEELLMFIIEQDDFALALDFIQPKLHINRLIETMRVIEDTAGISFSCVNYMILLRDFRSELYQWAAVYSSRINSTIDMEIAKRKVMTYSVLCEKEHRQEALREVAGKYVSASQSSFQLSNYFVDDYDSKSISKIFQHLQNLNNQKGTSCNTQIAAVIAVAWEQDLLCDTFNNTLQAVFDHFGITDKTDNYKPARLRRTNYKGNIPFARAQALKFFDSIDSRLLVY